MIELQVAELVLDWDFYPRHQLNTQHIASIVDAMRAGIEMPPVIVEKKSKRLVDGWKRSRAALHVHGKTATIQAVEKRYKNDAEFYLDAVRYNKEHGEAYSNYDRIHAALKAERLGLKKVAIAEALGMTVQKLESLEIRKTAVKTNGTEKIALKRSLGHMKGRRLNAQQRKVNEGACGWKPRFLADQLNSLISADLIDLKDKETLESLRQLLRTLGEFFETIKK